MKILFAIFLYTFILAAHNVLGHFSNTPVLLTDVKTLTLRKNEMTASRRTSPVPQLKCVGGVCSSFQPKVVQCYNKGSDGRDVQWQCQAEMPKEYEFGHISVSCEGYNYPDDPYILAGSCGLEYTLELSEYGRKHGGSSGGYFNNKHGHGNNAMGSIIFLIILVVVIVVVYKTCVNSTRGGPSPIRRGGLFGWGGNDGDGPPGGYPRHDDPPPPYGWNPGDDYSYKSTHSTASGTRGPGFWTGLGAGGLLGYLAGNRNRGGSYFNAPHPTHYSSWTDPGSSGYSQGFSGSSGSSSTHTSSGYGGTKRR